jgi:hypothetical protein
MVKWEKIAKTCFNDAVFEAGLTAQASEAASCGSTFYKPFRFFGFAFRLAPTLLTVLTAVVTRER